MRAVPGALAGHSRHDGVSMDPEKVTTGIAGLARLGKAWVGAMSMVEALSKWDDDSVSWFLNCHRNPAKRRLTLALRHV